jgi:hypothetical protein
MTHSTIDSTRLDSGGESLSDGGSGFEFSTSGVVVMEMPFGCRCVLARSVVARGCVGRLRVARGWLTPDRVVEL